MIQYVKGDATQPIGEGPKVIAHIVNNLGAWGAGFVVALSKRWALPEDAYREWEPELGLVQFVLADDQIFVANMCAQDNTREEPPWVDYDALRKCLAKLADFAAHHGASVHMPRIGCGIGGGRWDEVERIIREAMGVGVPVIVYDQDLVLEAYGDSGSED